MPSFRVFLAATAVLFGCDDYHICDDIPADQLAQLPQKLSETGLYQDTATRALAPGVRAYRPQFELWSDGAEKTRWVWLPTGASIDTSDPDFWQFPQGTRFWKQFTRDGIRVETRLLQKIGPAPEDWVALAYVWNDSLTDAMAMPEGQPNARGTPHDVPRATDCMGCHGGISSRVLGFSALQLAQDALPGDVDLRELIDSGVLSRPPAIPVVPGDALDQSVLGFLHANCGHCHNRSRPASTGSRCYDPQKGFELLLRVGSLGSVADTPAYRTAIGPGFHSGGTQSAAVVEVIKRGVMPPLATETVDVKHLNELQEWVRRRR
jgi:hypothetical protein